MCDVSVILPIHNGEKWIDKCMKSIVDQTAIEHGIKFEVVAFDDGSTDRTEELLIEWKKRLKNYCISLTLSGTKFSKGCGAAKNQAICHSKGEYLCFQDVDDIMLPERIRLQYLSASLNKNTLIGCQIKRTPPNSTPRLVSWANNLPQELLKIQIYTSHGPTLLMPTWFCHRSVYDRVGKFDESGPGTPEDLLFFYAHLDVGGDLIRVDRVLLDYAYHVEATTFSITREIIQQIQIARLETQVLPHWRSFTIWNAGKGGRKLVRALSPETRFKIRCFCDVDKNKVGKNIELYCPKNRKVLLTLPVIHFSEALVPLIICVKLQLTNGGFEHNLSSMNLIEGKDYVLFN